MSSDIDGSSFLLFTTRALSKKKSEEERDMSRKKSTKVKESSSSPKSSPAPVKNRPFSATFEFQGGSLVCESSREGLRALANRFPSVLTFEEIETSIGFRHALKLKSDPSDEERLIVDRFIEATQRSDLRVVKALLAVYDRPREPMPPKGASGSRGKNRVVVPIESY